jgi:tRNA pseudouridine55 synthase
VRAFGLLNIDKPAGVTSRKVVDRVARLVRPAKAGHAGTLDPLATGVLVVCVGPATRLIGMVQAQPKTYRATFRLGFRSDTDDVEGNVLETSPDPAVTRAGIERLLPRFTGRIEQVPPRYSAVHVEGRRAYDLARRGEEVALKPRAVDVHRIELAALAGRELTLEIECGSGTYVRSIGRDLGELLGCGAVMSELVRTRIGPFRIEQATPLHALTRDTLAEALLPATMAVSDLPVYRCSANELELVRQGRAVQAESLSGAGPAVAILGPDGSLAALAEYDAAARTLAPRQVFVR